MDIKMFDNIKNIVRDDMLSTIRKGSKLSIEKAVGRDRWMSFYIYISNIYQRKNWKTKERILYS